MVNNKIIGLITDFGDRGGHYVAAMKNVIKSIDDEVEIIDINHSIKPYSIAEASLFCSCWTAALYVCHSSSACH